MANVTSKIQGLMAGGNITITNHGRASSAEQLDLSSFTAYSDQDLRKILEPCAFDPDLVERALHTLSESRLLVLHGLCNIGKATTGLMLAAELLCADTPLCRMTPPLLKRDKVNLLGLLDAHKQGTVVIFQDALQTANGSIVDFLSSLDSYHVKHHISPRLVATNSYLIFTTTTEAIVSLRPALEETGLLVCQQSPDEELFESVLRRNLITEKQRYPQYQARAMSLMAKDAFHSLFIRLKTLPQLIQFLKTELMTYLKSEAELSELLAQYGDHERWFFEELTKDFGLWTKGIALALLSFENEEDVSWSHFTSLENWLRPKLKAHFRAASRQLNHQFIPSDQRILEALKAEFSERSYQPFIRFKGGREFSAELWRLLRRNGKSFLIPLIPLLKQTVEHEIQMLQITEKEVEDQTLSAPPSFTRRQIVMGPYLAAKVLGRLTLISPNYTVHQLIDEWSKDDHVELWFALGAFMVGVFAHGDQNYQQYCLDKLNYLGPESFLEPDQEAQPASGAGEALRPAAVKGAIKSADGARAHEATEKNAAGAKVSDDAKNRTGKGGASGDGVKSPASGGSSESGKSSSGISGTTSSSTEKDSKEKSTNAVDDKTDKLRASVEDDKRHREKSRAALVTCYFMLTDKVPIIAYQRIVNLTLAHLVDQDENWQEHFKWEEGTKSPELPPIGKVFGDPESFHLSFNPNLFHQLDYYGTNSGPVSLLSELKPYLAKKDLAGSNHLKSGQNQFQSLDLLTLFLLLPDGLFSRWAVSMPDPRPGVKKRIRLDKPYNFCVQEIATSQQAVVRLASMLNIIYENTFDLRLGITGMLLRKKLIDHLRNWVVFSMAKGSHVTHRDAMLSLVKQLLTKASRGFRQDVDRLLTNHAQFKDERIKLHLFARKALAYAASESEGSSG